LPTEVLLGFKIAPGNSLKTLGWRQIQKASQLCGLREAEKPKELKPSEMLFQLFGPLEKLQVRFASILICYLTTTIITTLVDGIILHHNERGFGSLNVETGRYLDETNTPRLVHGVLMGVKNLHLILFLFFFFLLSLFLNLLYLDILGLSDSNRNLNRPLL